MASFRMINTLAYWNIDKRQQKHLSNVPVYAS